jgi:hypothetical protein
MSKRSHKTVRIKGFLTILLDDGRMIEGSGSGSTPLTNGSGSERPKKMWIRWIRIRIWNTGYYVNIVTFKVILNGQLTITKRTCSAGHRPEWHQVASHERYRYRVTQANSLTNRRPIPLLLPERPDVTEELQ